MQVEGDASRPEDDGLHTPPDDSLVVGFVGAGQIGGPMVERLLGAGHRVRLYARRREVRERLAAAGAEIVDSAACCADADAVVCAVFDDEQLLEVGAQVVPNLTPEKVFISHTTGTPGAVDRLAALAAGRGAHIVDAPFSGNADAVRGGRLTVYLGGDEGTQLARHVVSAYAAPILPTGALGSALRVKLLNNLLFAAISQLTLRGVAVGRELGIEEDALLAALAVGSGGSNAGRHIAVQGGAERFAARVDHFLRKDIAACRAVAGELGVDISLLLRAAVEGPIAVHDPAPRDGVDRPLRTR